MVLRIAYRLTALLSIIHSLHKTRRFENWVQFRIHVKSERTKAYSVRSSVPGLEVTVPEDLTVGFCTPSGHVKTEEDLLSETAWFINTRAKDKSNRIIKTQTTNKFRFRHFMSPSFHLLLLYVRILIVVLNLSEFLRVILASQAYFHQQMVASSSHSKWFTLSYVELAFERTQFSYIYCSQPINITSLLLQLQFAKINTSNSSFAL